MADVVDRLVVATEFDERGLDRSVQAALSRIDRFTAGVERASRSLPEITLSTEPAQRALADAQAAFQRFIAEAKDLQAFPDFTTRDAQTELRELVEAFPGLQAAIEKIDPTGVFNLLANQARSAVTELQNLTVAEQQAAAAIIQVPSVEPPDFGRFLAESIQAADLVRNEFETALTGAAPALTRDAIAAARAVTDALQSGLLGRLGELRDLVATGLISPAEFAAQADRALEAFSRQVATQQRDIPPIRIRTELPRDAITDLIPQEELDKASEAFDGLTKGQGKLAGGFDLSRKGSRGLESALTAVASQAIGTSGSLGRVASGLLQIGGGTGAALGAATGIAVLASAYRFLSTATRELREEQDRLVKSLLSEADGALPKAAQAERGLVAALEAEKRARETLNRIRALAGPLAAATPLVGAGVPQFSEEFARRQLVAIRDAERAERQARENQKRGVLEFFALNARTLTESINLRQADTREIGRAQGLVTALLAKERDVSLTIGERLEIHKQIVDLQKALTAESERTLNFWKQFRAAEDAILDAQIQLVRVGFGDPGILTKTLTDAAAKARDLTQTDEDRLRAATRLNAAASALIQPLERQVQATQQSADNILRAFRATQSLSGLDSVLTLTGDTSALEDQIAAAEKDLARLRQQGASVTLAGDPTPILRDIETVEARLIQLRAQRGFISLAADDIGPLERQLADVDAALARLQRSGATATDAFRQLAQTRIGLVEKRQEAEQLAAEFLKIGQTPLELKFQATVDLASPDQALAALLKELQQRADERAFSLTLKALRVPVEVDTGLLGDAERAIGNLNTDLQRQGPIWRDANIRAERMVATLEDARTSAEQLADELAGVLDEFGAIAGSFGRAGQQLGLFGEDAVQALEHIQSAARDTADLITSIASGNVLGAVAGGLNLLGDLGGLLGGPNEHQRIVEDNLRTIARNTAGRNEAFQGIGGQSDLALKINQLLAGGLQGAVSTAAIIPSKANEDALNAFIRSFGLSVEDIQRVADQFDLTVVDKHGRLVADALGQLQKEILADMQASLRFRQTLDDLTLASDLRARISGDSLDPSAAFQRELDNAAKLGGSAVTDFFRNIDLGDPDALRQASLGLLDAFENGQLDAKKLGKLSREDILRILGDAAGLIEGLGQSAVDAAAELNIIPRGFRGAALAFQAQIEGLTATTVPARPIDVPLVDLALDPTDALDRLIPEPIQISGADLLDRLVALGAIPTSATVPGGPGDGAALPQLAAALTGSTAVLSQIAATLAALPGQPVPDETQTEQRELRTVLSRLADTLGKARIGTTINGDVLLQVAAEGRDARDFVRDIGQVLDDLRMADLGQTDPTRPG